MERWLILALACLLALPLAVTAEDKPPPEKPIAKLIQLRELKYEEILAIAKSMLSEEGTVGYIRSRNALMVYDQPRFVEKVRRLVADMDRDPVNIRIEIDFRNEKLLEERGTEVTLNYGGKRPAKSPRIVIKDGKVQSPRSVDVRLTDRRTTTRSNTSQSITTRSGGAARLRVATQVADPTWLKEYTLIPLEGPRRGEPLLFVETTEEREYRDVGSALYVEPTYMDNGLIEVEVFPVVTFVEGKGRKRRFRVQEVRTRVIVRPGQRVHIGGNDKAMRHYVDQLFGPDVRRREKDDDVLDIYLTAHVITAKSRRAGRRPSPLSGLP